MGKNLTSGRRVTLTNTSLSSLPIYTMGMYKVQEEICQQLDSIRAIFFGKGLMKILNPVQKKLNTT